MDEQKEYTRPRLRIYQDTHYTLADNFKLVRDDEGNATVLTGKEIRETLKRCKENLTYTIDTRMMIFSLGSTASQKTFERYLQTYIVELTNRAYGERTTLLVDYVKAGFAPILVAPSIAEEVAHEMLDKPLRESGIQTLNMKPRTLNGEEITAEAMREEIWYSRLSMAKVFNCALAETRPFDLLRRLVK